MLTELIQVRDALERVSIQGAWSEMRQVGGALDLLDQVVADLTSSLSVESQGPVVAPIILLDTVTPTNVVPGSPADQGKQWDPMLNRWNYAIPATSPGDTHDS